MILAGHLLMPGPGQTVTLTRGSIRVQGDRIAEVFADGRGPKPDLGGDDSLIAPGFVDAHLHLPQFDSIGVCGMPLLDWLATAIFPAEAKWADTAYAADMTRRVAAQLHAHGTTAVAAYATVHHDATVAAARVLADAGFAGLVGQVLMDREAPPELVRPAPQLLAEAARLQPVGRLRPAVTPRFAISCSEELLRGAGDLAVRNAWPVQTHLAETQAECHRVAELFDGVAYTEVYRRAGLLTPRTLLAHGVQLSDHDRTTINAAGSTIAHCPTANGFLKSGDMDLAAHQRAGLNIALGSDIAGGYERSMPRVARAALETASRVHPDSTCPSAAWAWWQLTAGNATALGLTDTGRIHPGAAADLLVLKPDIRWHASADPLATLLYAWDDRWLKTTIAAGRPVYAASA